MSAVPGHPFSAVEVLDILPSLSCALSPEESAGHVQVVQASHVGARRFDELILAGLTSREFPRATRETFSSEMLALATGRAAPCEEAVLEVEFYSLLTRPRRRLALVRQTVDSEGAPQLASPFLDRILGLYRDPIAGVEDDDLSRAPETVKSRDTRAFAPAFTRGRREARLLPASEIPSGRTVVRGSVSADIASRMAQDRVFSATELETYLKCPYSWFYARVLRPRDLDAEMDAAAIGSRAHRLISEFYAAMRREGRERVTAQTLPEDIELFERTAAGCEDAMGAAQGLAEEIDAGRAHLWARHVVEDDAYLLPGYAPSGHEVEFGRDRTFEFAGVSIAGRIDRIDVGPAGAVVTDYKSTRDVGSLVGAGRGSSIQHVLYALAAERSLGLPVVGSVYRSLRGRQLRGYWRSDLLSTLPTEACEKDAMDEDGFSAMVETLEQRVAGAIEGIRAGEIPRTPSSADACRYCGIRQVCGGALK